MTWTCLPEANRAGFPGFQAVRFNYLQAPRYHEVEVADHLCDQLTAANKPTVAVDFVVFGDPWDGMRGYRTEAVDGRPLHSVDGSSGVSGDSPGRFPLDGYIPHHKLR